MGEKVFMQGNAALSESAIRAGCKMFFGYPITPSSEMPEYYAAEAPKRDLVFVQAETEVAAFNMIAGAAAAYGIYRFFTPDYLDDFDDEYDDEFDDDFFEDEDDDDAEDEKEAPKTKEEK